MVHGRCFSGIPKKLCMCVQRKTMAGRGIYLKDNLSAKRGFGADPSIMRPIKSVYFLEREVGGRV